MKKFAFLLIGLLATAISFAACPVKVSILGDSYSTFQNHVTPDSNYVWYFQDENKPERTDVNRVEDTWWTQFIKNNGFVLEKNNSFSGATVCNLGYNGEDYSDRAFIKRMHYLGNPDLILVFGATNDCWAKVPLGDDNSDDLYTFIPAMKKMLSSLPGLYPHSKVVFMLNDEIQGDMREAIIRLCDEAGVDCLQLTGISKRQGHPDRKGMTQISHQLTEFLKPAGCCTHNHKQHRHNHNQN